MAVVTRASTVYAEPVERDGITIIPVAKVSWGIGGGEGTNAQGNSGTGGGGNVRIVPVGYIEVTNGHAKYKPIFDPALIVQFIISSGLTTILILSAVRKIIQIARS